MRSFSGTERIIAVDVGAPDDVSPMVISKKKKKICDIIEKITILPFNFFFFFFFPGLW